MGLIQAFLGYSSLSLCLSLRHYGFAKVRRLQIRLARMAPKNLVRGVLLVWFSLLLAKTSRFVSIVCAADGRSPQQSIRGCREPSALACVLIACWYLPDAQAEPESTEDAREALQLDICTLHTCMTDHEWPLAPYCILLSALYPFASRHMPACGAL